MEKRDTKKRQTTDPLKRNFKIGEVNFLIAFACFFWQGVAGQPFPNDQFVKQKTHEDLGSISPVTVANEGFNSGFPTK